ncbi:MAG: hypothetical protein HUJ63_11480 [Enterococcus sp.]|nr:hypothetical protein [Enterococcus sp.]
MSYYKIVCNDELYHFGVKNQQWGVRNYQNKDGTLTDAGKKHLAKLNKKKEKALNNVDKFTKLREESYASNNKKAAKLEKKAAKLRVKEYSLFTTKDKADKLEYKAKKLDVKAKSLRDITDQYESLSKKYLEEANLLDIEIRELIGDQDITDEDIEALLEKSYTIKTNK